MDWIIAHAAYLIVHLNWLTHLRWRDSGSKTLSNRFPWLNLLRATIVVLI